MNKFKKDTELRHLKGGTYVIVEEPNFRRLSDSNQPFYEYRSLKDGIVWIRSKSEMEDGRFFKLGELSAPVNINQLRNIVRTCLFDADLNWVDVSQISDMTDLFRYCTFNGKIDQWDVSNVVNMHSMFLGSYFDGDISKWDVSNVTIMTTMFQLGNFNQTISDWDVSNVDDMSDMFSNSPFNGDVSNWTYKTSGELSL